MRHAVAGAFTGLHLILAVHAPCVRAQPVDAVVIEATRFPEVARTLPASVTVLTAEDIAESAARTLPELLSQQAGIAMHDFFGNNAAATGVDLRGFGVTGQQNTLILIDGRRATDLDVTGVHWAAIPLAAVWLVAPERVLLERVAPRELDASDADVGVVRMQCAQWANDVRWPQLDAARDLETVAAAARTLLQTQIVTLSAAA